MLLAVLAGCTPSTAPAPPQGPTRVEAEAIARSKEVLPAQDASDENSQAIGVEVGFHGVSSLYQAFFGDAKARRTLGRNLWSRVVDPARLKVGYDSETRIGNILLVVPPDNLKVPVAHNGHNIHLEDLTPLTWALANYRDDLAARFDIRIQSFNLGLAFFRGTTSCSIGVAGDNPSDGTIISPCVEVNGVEHCGMPGDEGVLFDSDVARALRTCLDLNH